MRSPSTARALVLIVLLALAGCESGGGGGSCPEPGACTESPVGSWELLQCSSYQRFTHVESIDGGPLKRCVLELDANDIASSGALEIVATGRFTRTTSESGHWSGLVEPGCEGDFGLTCPELTAVFATWGGTSCSETDAGCRCSGDLDRTSDAAGDWQTGSGMLNLAADDNSTEAFAYCAGEVFMRLGEGEDALHYRAR